MKFTLVNPAPNIALAILDGRLDIIGANEIDMPFSTTVAAQEVPVLIDLDKVSFISSMGLRMLLGAAQALKRKNVHCALVAPQPLIKESLATAGLAAALPIYSTLEEGLAATQAS